VEKELTYGIVAVMTIAVLGFVAQAMMPRAPYQCPVCGQRFYTYDELYSHFTAEHPAEPIDIIWESGEGNE